MQTTPKYIVLLIVSALVLVVVLGMLGTYMLIINKAEPAHVALFSGFSGTALGGLMTILSNTRSNPGADPPTVKETTITETKSNPDPTV